MSTSDNVKWLNTKQTAAKLGITLRTLYRQIDEGELPAYKFGRVIRLMEHEVDEYVQSARVQRGDLCHLYPSGYRGEV